MNFKKKISKMVLALATVGLMTMSFNSIATAATLQTIRTGTFNNAARLVLNFDELPSYSISVEDNTISLAFKGDIDPKSLQDIVLKDDDVQDLGMAKIAENENVFTITYKENVTGYKVFSLRNPARIVIDKGADLKVPAIKAQAEKKAPLKEKTNEPVKEKAIDPVVENAKTTAKKVENNTSNKANIVIPTKAVKVIDTPNGKVTLQRLGDGSGTFVKSESTEVSPSSN